MSKLTENIPTVKLPPPFWLGGQDTFAGLQLEPIGPALMHSDIGKMTHCPKCNTFQPPRSVAPPQCNLLRCSAEAVLELNVLNFMSICLKKHS